MLPDFLHGDGIASEEFHLLLEPDDIGFECTNVTPSLIMRRHLVTAQSERQTISSRVDKERQKRNTPSGAHEKWMTKWEKDDLRIGRSEGEDGGDFEQFGPTPVRAFTAKVGVL